MKHTHEKLADAEPKLEEDIIVPTRRKVFEGGSLSLGERRGPPPIQSRPVKEKQARGTRECSLCGATISANKEFCRNCNRSLSDVGMV